jgi:CheY-like chemotaxis protein
MSGAPQGGRLVIVVEDTRDCAAALEVALSAGGCFKVRSCVSAEEALELIGSHKPCAVVTDIHLPGISGLSLIARLRKLYPGTRLKIIAVSGDGCPQLKEQALSAGAQAFFPKPYSPLAVRRVLEELVDEE